MAQNERTLKHLERRGCGKRREENVGSHERGGLSLILDTQALGTVEVDYRRKPKEKEEEEEWEGEASAVVSWITQLP